MDIHCKVVLQEKKRDKVSMGKMQESGQFEMGGDNNHNKLYHLSTFFFV